MIDIALSRRLGQDHGDAAPGRADPGRLGAGPEGSAHHRSRGGGPGDAGPRWGITRDTGLP